jgi:hypothetical protein
MNRQTKTRNAVTHLSLTEQHRGLAGLRSAQLGLSLSGYFEGLVADAEQSGLAEALDRLRKIEEGTQEAAE